MKTFLLRFQEQMAESVSNGQPSDAPSVRIESATQTTTKIAQETSDRDPTANTFRAIPVLAPITPSTIGNDSIATTLAGTKTITEVKRENADRSLTPLDIAVIPTN